MDAKTFAKTLSVILNTYVQEAMAEEILDKLSARFDEDLLDEAISAFFLKFAEGKVYLELEKYSANEALNYVKRCLYTSAMSLQRKKPLLKVVEVTDEELEMVVDTRSNDAIADFEGPWNSPKVRKLLETKAHPDAPAYLDLILEGHSSRSIVGDTYTGVPSMLPHVKADPMTYSGWQWRINDKIAEILIKY